MTDQSLMTATRPSGAPSRTALTAAWAAERAAARTARAAGDLAVFLPDTRATEERS
jgi:hypothetical protein